MSPELERLWILLLALWRLLDDEEADDTLDAALSRAALEELLCRGDGEDSDALSAATVASVLDATVRGTSVSMEGLVPPPADIAGTTTAVAALTALAPLEREPPAKAPLPASAEGVAGRVHRRRRDDSSASNALLDASASRSCPMLALAALDTADGGANAGPRAIGCTVNDKYSGAPVTGSMRRLIDSVAVRRPCPLRMNHCVTLATDDVGSPRKSSAILPIVCTTLTLEYSDGSPVSIDGDERAAMSVSRSSLGYPSISHMVRFTHMPRRVASAENGDGCSGTSQMPTGSASRSRRSESCPTVSVSAPASRFSSIKRSPRSW
jgi:hypothetical protein